MSSRTRSLCHLCLIMLWLTSPLGCGGEKSESANQSARNIPEWAKAEAAKVYKSRCAVCHGETGQGDGPASAGLDPKPRNHADPTWQASVTDEYIEKIIIEGGAGVGKSILMPPNPDLKDKLEVVAGLRRHIRDLVQ